MQVKKFEAPTMQEALDTIKRELGPEAIILQTKQNKSGFGILSKGSVEVTAAVSDRSMIKKKRVDNRVAESTREAMTKMPAQRQVEIYDKYAERATHRAKHAAALYGAGVGSEESQSATSDDHVSRAMKSSQANQARDQVRITSRRYADIDRHEVPEPPAVAPSSPEPRAGSAAVEAEMKQIKRMLAELRSAQDESRGVIAGGQGSKLTQPAIQDTFDELVLHGLDRRIAFQMMKQVAFDLGEERAADPVAVQDHVAGMLMESVKVAPFLDSVPKRVANEAGDLEGSPRLVALVGPTGVGKTTSVAKIASQALLQRSLKVGLINLDNYKVAASEQLQAYAKALNLPFRNAVNAEEFAAAIRDFQKLDLVLIDTAGRSQRDPSALAEMRTMLEAAGAPVMTQLVLSVTTRDQELSETAQRFAIFEPQGLVFSKLDEASTFGAIINVSQRAKLPLVFFATGQRVPEDIETATPERVVSLMMDL